MNDQKAQKWLYGQLPQLVDNGVISDQDAAAIRQYYDSKPPETKLPLAVTIFASIGAVCIGLGIILLFAHNWDFFSRELRVVLSFMPTVLSLALVSWAVAGGKKSAAKREGFAIFNILSVGATISLISQTYQIHGDISTFLLTWMLICVPVVYLLESTLAAIAYLAGITIWAMMIDSRAVLFWPLSWVIVPHFIRQIRRAPHASQWLSVGFVISYACGIGLYLGKSQPPFWLIVYSMYFSALYLLGAHYRYTTNPAWAIPVRRLSVTAITVFTFLLSFHPLWEDFGWQLFRVEYTEAPVGITVNVVLLALLTGCVVNYLLKIILSHNWFETVFGIVPLITIAGFIITASTAAPYLSGWFFSAYVLTLGIITITTGLRNQRLATTNAGIIIIVLLIIARFMEADLSILMRAIIFILAGTGFLVSNLILSRKMRGGMS